METFIQILVRVVACLLIVTIAFGLIIGCLDLFNDEEHVPIVIFYEDNNA